MAKTEYNEQERIRVGALLKSIRESKGMTLEQVGELAGITRQNVQKIEAARYASTLDTLSSVARALGVQITFEDLNS